MLWSHARPDLCACNDSCFCNMLISKQMTEVEEAKRSLNIAPTWEGSAKALLLIIDQSTIREDVEWAKSEVVRMGQIIDWQKKNTKELLESI